jgi:hypothetical protein
MGIQNYLAQQISDWSQNFTFILFSYFLILTKFVLILSDKFAQ